MFKFGLVVMNLQFNNWFKILNEMRLDGHYSVTMQWTSNHMNGMRVAFSWFCDVRREFQNQTLNRKFDRKYCTWVSCVWCRCDIQFRVVQTLAVAMDLHLWQKHCYYLLALAYSEIFGRLRWPTFHIASWNCTWFPLFCCMTNKC